MLFDAAQLQDTWHTNPFTMTCHNEYVYGRGVTDDKGPILASLFAVKELLVSGAFIFTLPTIY